MILGALVYRLSVWCGAVGYVSGLRDAALLVYNEELNDLYSSLNITGVIKSRRDGLSCSTHGERRGVYRVLVGKPEGKRPLERPRCRWEDNIKMDL